MNPSAIKGREAEDIAADYLQKKGYKILTRNFRIPRGEVDIIAQDKRTLVFVEVRMRSSASFGGAIASVHRPKQRRILRAAIAFLKKHGLFATGPRGIVSWFRRGRSSLLGPLFEGDLRFDILALDGKMISHIENAFSHDGLIL